MMSASFLFSCCNQSSAYDESNQSTTYSLNRNLPHKNKPYLPIHSPKASLRVFNSIKNSNNSPGLDTSMNVKTGSTLRETNDIKYEHSKVTELGNPYSTRNTEKPTNNFLLQSPVHSYNSTVRPRSIKKKSCFNLTYEGKKHNTYLQTMPKIMHKASKRKSLRMNSALFTPRQEPMKPKNIQSYGLCPEYQEQREQKKAEVAHSAPYKFKLGGSKFTIMSEGEMESNEERSYIVDESAILIDIFHPSQIQKVRWQTPNPPVPIKQI